MEKHKVQTIPNDKIETQKSIKLESGDLVKFTHTGSGKIDWYMVSPNVYLGGKRYLINLKNGKFIGANLTGDSTLKTLADAIITSNTIISLVKNADITIDYDEIVHSAP